MDERDVAQAERDLRFASWTQDHASGRLPADARRGMFPHERNAGTNFAEIEKDTAAAHEALYAGMITDVAALARIVETATMDIPQADAWMIELRHKGLSSHPAVDGLVERAVLRNYRILDDVAAAGWLSVAQEVPEPAVVAMKEPVGLLDFVAMAEALDRMRPELLTAAWRGVTGVLGDVLGIMINAASALQPWGDIARGLTLKSQSIDYGRVLATNAHRTGRLVAQVVARQALPVAAAMVAVHVARGLLPEAEPTAEPEVPEATQIYASELHDSNACSACLEVDGRNYPSMAAALRDYPNGIYQFCEAGPRCRGMLVIVWAEPGAGPPTIVVPSLIRRMRNRRQETIAPKVPVEGPHWRRRRST